MGKNQKEGRKRWNNLRRFYQLYKSGLSLVEIERLIRRDVPGVYDFYRRDMEEPDHGKNTVIRTLTLARNLFVTFLLKLTAARRLLYSVAIILFVYGIITGLKWWQFVAFILINILLALEVADKLLAKDELEVARDIQISLMPKIPPPEIPHDIACFSEPALEVGGDYYDFLIPNHGKFQSYIVIGDVKGKGMAAALYMVRVQALLQYLADIYESPASILIALNKNVRKILSNDYFISMAIAGIDKNGRFKLSRAGHMPFIHYAVNSNRCTVLQPGGMAVGLENGSIFERDMEEISLVPEPGDFILFYTDGLVETMDSGGNQYNDEPLQSVVRKNRDGSAEEMKIAILKDLAKFRGPAPPHDDLTLIVVKITAV